MPLTPRGILELAQRDAPGLGIATVYRTVRELLADGTISIVDLPGEPVHYELAGRGHHHHFQCRGCSAVYEVRGCPEGLSRLTPKGFRLERHELVLYGLCNSCAA